MPLFDSALTTELVTEILNVLKSMWGHCGRQNRSQIIQYFSDTFYPHYYYYLHWFV